MKRRVGGLLAVGLTIGGLAAGGVFNPGANTIGRNHGLVNPLKGGGGGGGGEGCTVEVSSLAAANTEVQKTGSPVVCLTAGTYSPTTHGEAECKVTEYSTPEFDLCWLVPTGPASGIGTIQPAVPGTVTIKGLVQLYGSRITLKGLTVGQVKVGLSEETYPEHDSLISLTGVDFHIGSSKFTTVEKGSWGPSACDPVANTSTTLAEKKLEPGWPGANNKVEESWAAHDPEEIVIKEAVIHDIQSYKLAAKEGGSFSEECHTEGLAIFAGNKVTVTGNRFYKNSVYDVFVQSNSGGKVENLVVSKNWMAAPRDETNQNGVPVGTVNGIPMEMEVASKVEIRANHAHGVLAVGQKALYTNVSVLYNFANIPFASYSYCTEQVGIVWTENVWQNAESKCVGTTDTALKGAGFPFVNTADDATLNYGLTGGFVGWPE